MSTILLTTWHLGLRDTPWLTIHVDGRLKWLREHELQYHLPGELFDKEKVQRAIEKLIKKRLLSLRIQGALREYRVDAENMWTALSALPEPLPNEEEIGGYEA
jgi:hypothetical protein